MNRIWFDVKAQSVAESNLLLRALWAALRSRAGSYAWAFGPSKDGPSQIITFGRASFPGRGVVGFGICYRQRGVIDRLWVLPEEGAEPLLSDIAASVEDARANLGQPQAAWIAADVAVFPRAKMTSYASAHITLQGVSDEVTRLGVRVSGYDWIDRESEFVAIADKILNALSVFTNCSFRYVPPSSAEEAAAEPNARWASADWLDNAPVVEGRLAITAGQLMYLEALAVEPSDSAAVRAARHFHQALRLEYAGTRELTDAVRTLYLSALEAVSVPEQDPSRCGQCGQAVYSIRSRVRSISARYLGEAAERIIDRAYQARSGFLHTGSVLGKRPSEFGAQPQLDPEAESGCILPSGLDNTLNIREFTSFVLRSITREQWPEPQTTS